MSAKLKTEKITKANPLTIKEQQMLLDDLLMMEALVLGYENYCRSINKFNEAIEFVKKFVDGLEYDKLRNMLTEKDGEA